LREAGTWPLGGLRQSFLNGSLTRLLDPDSILRGKIVEFVNRGDFGLASGLKADGTYDRVWYGEMISADEVAFELGVFLLTKAKAQVLKCAIKSEPSPVPESKVGGGATLIPEPTSSLRPEPAVTARTRVFHVAGKVPPEVWNRLGTRILPKLRSGTNLEVGVEFSVTVDNDAAKTFESDLRQILDDLGLADKVKVQ
jgi:hypothetical protein